jgi:hypothetical protein
MTFVFQLILVTFIKPWVTEASWPRSEGSLESVACWHGSHHSCAEQKCQMSCHLSLSVWAVRHTCTECRKPVRWDKSQNPDDVLGRLSKLSATNSLNCRLPGSRNPGPPMMRCWRVQEQVWESWLQKGRWSWLGGAIGMGAGPFFFWW